MLVLPESRGKVDRGEGKAPEARHPRVTRRYVTVQQIAFCPDFPKTWRTSHPSFRTHRITLQTSTLKKYGALASERRLGRGEQWSSQHGMRAVAYLCFGGFGLQPLLHRDRLLFGCLELCFQRCLLGAGEE